MLADTPSLASISKDDLALTSQPHASVRPTYGVPKVASDMTGSHDCPFQSHPGWAKDFPLFQILKLYEQKTPHVGRTSYYFHHICCQEAFIFRPLGSTVVKAFQQLCTDSRVTSTSISGAGHLT